MTVLRRTCKQSIGKPAGCERLRLFRRWLRLFKFFVVATRRAESQLFHRQLMRAPPAGSIHVGGVPLLDGELSLQPVLRAHLLAP